MILQRTIVPALALLVAIVTTSVTLFVGIGDAPSVFFGDPDVVLMLPPGELVPGQGSVDASLVEALEEHESVRRVSPEIYAATLVDGRSILVRGVAFEPFLALDGARIVEGREARDATEAVAGAQLARALDLGVGDELVVPGAKSGALVRFTLVGLLDSRGPTRDELFTTLEGARALVDLPPRAVHVVRIDPLDRGAAVALVRGAGPSFSYSDVTLSSTEPIPGEVIVLRARLTNWGLAAGAHQAVVRADEEIVAMRTYRVPARASIDVEIPFAMPMRAVSNVSINPTFAIEPREPELQIEPPTTIALGAPAAFRVVDVNGTPAGGVTLVAGETEAVTDAEGRASITPRAAGILQVKALLDGRTAGVVDVFVAQEGAATRAVTRVENVVVESAGGLVRANETVRVTVHMLNVGGVDGEMRAAVQLDGAPAGNASALAAPGARVAVALELGPLAPGEHTVSVAGIRHVVTATEGDPAIEAILRRYDAIARGEGVGADVGGAQAAYVETVTGNVRAAILALSIATGGLAAAAGVAVLARHLGERAPILGTLKAVGASDHQVKEIASREALRYAALATAAGIAAGAFAAKGIEATRWLHAFGHQIHPRYPWHVLALIFLLGTTCIVLVARAQVGGLLRRPADALLRGEIRPGT